MNNYRRFLRIVFIFTVVCVFAAAVVLMLSRSREREEFRFSRNTKIQGVDIGGLSYKQAQSRLDESITVPYKFRLVVKAGDKSFCLTQANFTFVFDYQTALDSARDYTESHSLSRNESFELPYRVESGSVRAAVRKLAGLIDKMPENARIKKFRPFSKKRFSFEKEKNGTSLDRTSLYNMISDFLSSRKASGEIKAITDSIKPEVTAEFLKKSIKKLAAQQSYSYNTENGTTNMRLALDACNGSVLEPGAVWSFNEHTGDSNSTANGYRKAEVILHRKLTQGVGGGICQASTTIFRTAVLANLGIEERHNHHWASGYTMSGEDATIDYPSLDLKLKNKSKYPVFIESRLIGRRLEVSIYGIMPKSYDKVKMYSKNYDIKQGIGYRTATYRVLYKKKKAVKRERVCTSYYSLKEYHGIRAEDSGSFSD